jgi:hypothetical protein
MNDPREEKLPRWARELLLKERRRADDAERKLDDHLKTVEKTQVWYGNYDNQIYVPSGYGQQIHFDTTGNNRYYEQISVRLDDGALYVMGGRPLSLEPEASNTCRVRMRER